MYESFYGLKERPFELTPNPRFLCRTPRHREALTNLEYGIATGRGITLLIGDAGTGKTTLIRTALKTHEGADALCVCLNNPTLGRQEFLQFLSDGFSLGPEAPHNKTILLRELERLLQERRQRGAVTALVIDEAQSLSHELLEEIRLLANIETDEVKLLPVVLAGQPELANRLNEPALRQLKQRVALRCSLLALDLRETAAYIASRIRVAGGDSARLFTREAVEMIHQRSRGIPRTISVICDNALVTGFAVGEQPVSSKLIREVCDDFDLRQGRGSVALAPVADSAAAHHAAPPAAPQQPAEEAATPEPPLDEAVAGLGRRRRFSFF
jgi:type II secretory pathway predicted ATPase ExeA